MAKDKNKAKSKKVTTKGAKGKGARAGTSKGGKGKGTKRSSGKDSPSAGARRDADGGSPSRLSGPHTWTIEQLASSVPRFEESLRAAGLAESTVRNYVTRSISFLAFVEQERSDEDADV